MSTSSSYHSYNSYSILVGGFNHLEKYESQLGRIIPYIMENKSHVPNHQPMIILVVHSCSTWVPTASTAAQETAGPRRELRSALLGARDMDEGELGAGGGGGSRKMIKMGDSTNKIRGCLIHLNPQKMVMSSCFARKMVHIPTMT